MFSGYDNVEIMDSNTEAAQIDISVSQLRPKPVVSANCVSSAQGLFLLAVTGIYNDALMTFTNGRG